jgi:hypothetical protein
VITKRLPLLYGAGWILIRGTPKPVSLSASPLTFLMTSSSNRRSLSISSSSRPPASATVSPSRSKRDALISTINERKSCSRVAASGMDPEAPIAGDVVAAVAMQDSPKFSERDTCLLSGSGRGSVLAWDRSGGHRLRAERTVTSAAASVPATVIHGQPISASLQGRDKGVWIVGDGGENVR